MQLRKYRWSKDYESAEEALVDLLAYLNIDAGRWTAEPGHVFEPRTLEHDRKLWCAEGSMIITIDGKRISLQTGDALDIPAKTEHAAQAGFSGCAFYEA